MSEGLLKKRIEKYEVSAGEIIMNTPRVSDVKLFISTPILKTILDEAKQDFAELRNVRLFNLKYGSPESHQDLYDLAQQYQVKTIEKIAKWFGETDIMHKNEDLAKRIESGKETW